jgi:hypothetical protein
VLRCCGATNLPLHRQPPPPPWCFKHVDQLVLCHHNPHRKAMVEPSLRPQRRLHQESRCQTLCTLSCDAHPLFSSHPEPSSADRTREQRTKKKEYTDPLDLVWAHLNQLKDTIPGRNRIRQTRPRICRKSVHASVFFRYQTLNFFIQALILFILSDIMIRDHPYIDFSWGLYCFCLTVTWTLSIVFFTASPCLTKPLSLFLPRGGPV